MEFKLFPCGKHELLENQNANFLNPNKMDSSEYVNYLIFYPSTADFLEAQ